jgi:hypothetical protein
MGGGQIEVLNSAELARRLAVTGRGWSRRASEAALMILYLASDLASTAGTCGTRPNLLAWLDRRARRTTSHNNDPNNHGTRGWGTTDKERM